MQKKCDETPHGDESSDDKLLTNSTALVAHQWAYSRSVFTMTVIYQCCSHGPVIQAVLFHFVLSVANDFHMQQWLQLSCKHTSWSYEKMCRLF